MYFSISTATLALLLSTAKVSAYLTSPGVGPPKCNLVPNNPTYNSLDCTTTTNLRWCNVMCDYQGTNPRFWPSKYK